MHSTLFEPITLRGLTVRNRLWIPPMCQYAAFGEDGVPTDWHLVHYGSLAAGGAGAVIVEAIAVVPEGRISPRDLGLWNDEQRDALARIVDFAHGRGAAIGVQLAHAGRKASTHAAWGTEHPGQSLPAAEGGWQTVGPSAVAFPGLDAPEELDARGIDDVVAAFAASARRAVEVGMDFVELHGAHGYLLHEFLSPLSNERTDEHGGSLENRARLLLRVTDAVRDVIPGDMPLLVRLSATDWTDGGLTVADTSRVSGWLAEHGADLIDVSSAANVPAEIPVGPGYQVPLATEIRSTAGVPVAAVGMIDTAWQAEQIVATGLADVVLMGREALRDPHVALTAAHALGVPDAPVPGQYERAYRRPPRTR
ncbi:oxidoreductase [Kocuria tytonicola]|uniref:NADH:flavin oxidoreductase/NADH oxidase n=1 Tax=Kocuria tytonicola TaxID=2055946 RepID=UPI000EF8B6EC|nr:NADH:flavin oxidoreductase/NADH oxidase [Kocuria tytonicola]RLZ02622.1 oxidoreductase [Kocuria tytonicola]